MGDGAKRAYSRGYAAGHKVGQRAYNEAREEAEAAHRRARHAQTAAGIGRCADCSAWRRGDNGAYYSPTVNAEWGTCGRSAGAVNSWEWWRAEKGVITTKPDFGCVLFTPRP